MKKLLLIVTAVATLSGLSAFGQGYFVFSGAVRGNWDLWSGATAHPSASNRLAFLWASSGVPTVDSIMTSVGTNNATPIDYVAAWNFILSDPNFHVALNQTDGSVAVAQSAANGAWQYAANQTFPVAGTSVSAYQCFVIGWSGGWANPAAAAAAGAIVGWSAPFTYNAVSQIGTPLSMPASGLLPFGVGVVPEPTTFALAGLGAAAMLIFRRRK